MQSTGVFVELRFVTSSQHGGQVAVCRAGF